MSPYELLTETDVCAVASLEWRAKGWHPNQPVPGSMLVFELHSSHDERVVSVKTQRRLSSAAASHFVKLYFVAASPAQMRYGDALSDQNVRLS